MKKLRQFTLLILVLSCLLPYVAFAATDVKTDMDYVAPCGVNLLELWGFGLWNYEKTTNTTNGLYGWNGSNVDANASGGKRASRSIGEGFISNKSGTSTRTAGAGTNGTLGAVKTFPTGTGNDGPRIVWIPCEAGEIYEISVDMKINDAEIESTTAVLDASSTSGSLVAVSARTSVATGINNKEFKTVKGWFSTKAGIATGYDRQHVHAGFKLSNADVRDVIVDNWKFVKVAKPAVTEASVHDYATAKFVFDGAISTITKDNFVVTPTPENVYFYKRGKTCIISLSGCDADTEYTVTTKNIKDDYGRELTENKSVVLDTGDAGYPFSRNQAISEDYDFELSAVGSDAGLDAGAVKNNAGAASGYGYAKGVVTDADSYTGEQSAIVTLTPYTHTDGKVYHGGRIRWNYIKANLEVGKMYAVSYWTKLASTPSGTVTTTAHIGQAGSSNVNPITRTVTKTMTNEWQRVTGYFTCKEKTPSGTPTNGDAHIGIAFDTTISDPEFKCYIDNFQIRELKTLSYDTNVAASATKVKNDVYVELRRTANANTRVGVMAVKYSSDGRVEDSKLSIIDVGDTPNATTVKFADADGYEIMIWNMNFGPVGKAIPVSEIH